VSRFRVDHPSDPNLHVIAGVDHMLGLFVELCRTGRSRPIKTLDFFTAGKPVTMSACFEFLIEHGFFTRDDLEDALTAVADDTNPKDLPSGIARTVDVVMSFKAAGD
jgi:hypothetical protein